MTTLADYWKNLKLNNSTDSKTKKKSFIDPLTETSAFDINYNLTDPLNAPKPDYSTDQIINQLTTSWGGGDTTKRLWAASPSTPSTPKATITFGVNTSNPTNFTGYSPSEGSGLVTMTPLQVATARLSFHIWDDLISSSLVESGGAGANITLNYSSNTGNSTYARPWIQSTTPKNIIGEQIWLASSWTTNADAGMVNGGYGFNTMIHEIGHALGLSHPGTYNGTATYAADAVFAQDNRQNTIMSYFGTYDTVTNTWLQDGTYVSSTGRYQYSQTPMVYDIAAIQSLYGADLTTRTGDTTYGYNCNLAANDSEKSIFDFSMNTKPLFTIWDAGGNNDTLDGSGWGGNQTINLAPGSYSSVRGLNNNVGIAFGTTIERAVGGGGNDILNGNAAANVLNGGMGADSMTGGLGDDTYSVDNVGDVVTENINEGIDTVQSSISYMLGANLENLTLTGTAAINGTGNELSNVLTGNAAANVLDGGVGADRLIGGVGNDTYVVDNGGDVVIENINEGIDTVQSSISYMLGANLENLTLTGTAAINGTGNELSNVLTGNAAANVLDGGVGADSMTGGAGDDTYYIDNAGDTVTELAGEGDDLLYSTLSWTLGTNQERLSLIGAADINATGNALDNTLYGHANSGANILTGGMGNDTYYVGSNDSVIEQAGEGTDTVFSHGNYTLSANLENLRLNVTTAATLSGNELANVITGNTGNDTLSGGLGNDTLKGGVGADSMTGGAGNDSYYIDNAGDTVTELAGEGDDILFSTLSWSLGANQEGLYLTGTANVNATGNALDNKLYGYDNSGANVLTGGLGNDTYYVGSNDSVIELAGEGTDTVYSYGNYTLSANLENLRLYVTTAATLNGNELANVITGNTGNDTLSGGLGNDSLNGAAGADSLIGGAGDDSYYIDNLSLIHI